MAQQIDFGLMKFATYEDYLDSITHLTDYHYIRHMKSTRKLAMIGHHVSKVYTAIEFIKIKNQIFEKLNPKSTSTLLYGRNYSGNDEVLKALAEREEPNILKKLAVIHIYIYIYII